MTKYLVTIHHPHDYDPSLEDEAMGRNIDVLNEEMVAAGIRVFVGGLHAPSRAKSVRAALPGGKNPCHGRTLRKPEEHVGGVGCSRQQAWTGELRTWARKATVACRVPVEVRPFH